MNFQSTMLTEISQTEKDKYHMISLICGILKKKKTNKQNQKQNQTTYIHSLIKPKPKTNHVNTCTLQINKTVEVLSQRDER